MAKKVSRVEFGCPGHLIAASSCRWRRHTEVGAYRISTLGDLYYHHEPQKRQTLGASEDSFVETMVFRLSDAPVDGNEGCGCRKVEDWGEIDGKRYATAGEAQAGHESFVTKYSKITP